jgi:hypothetical protein
MFSKKPLPFDKIKEAMNKHDTERELQKKESNESEVKSNIYQEEYEC